MAEKETVEGGSQCYWVITVRTMLLDYNQEIEQSVRFATYTISNTHSDYEHDEEEELK